MLRPSAAVGDQIRVPREAGGNGRDRKPDPRGLELGPGTRSEHPGKDARARDEKEPGCRPAEPGAESQHAHPGADR